MSSQKAVMKEKLSLEKFWFAQKWALHLRKFIMAQSKIFAAKKFLRLFALLFLRQCILSRRKV